jgi:hypothetical protein
MASDVRTRATTPLYMPVDGPHPIAPPAARASRFGRWDWLVMLAYIGLTTCLGARIGQDMNWDLFNYHFYNPYLLLADRFERDVHVAGVQTYLNPIMDLPFYVAVAIWKLPPLAVGLMLSALHGIALWLVHRVIVLLLARQGPIVANLGGMLGAVTSSFGAGFYSVIGSTMADNTIALPVLAGLALILRTPDAARAPALADVRAAGFLVGLAAGAKPVAGIFAFGLTAVCLAAPGPMFGRALRTVYLWLCLGAGLLLTGGYWMWLMASHYGSPLFPFYNTIFRSPLAPVDRDLAFVRFLPATWMHTLFYPFFFIRTQDLVAEVPFRDARFAVVFVAIAIVASLALVRHWQRRATLIEAAEQRLGLLILFWLTSYAVWLKAYSYYRYAIPLELLAPAIVIGCTAYAVRDRIAALALMVSVCALLIGTTKPFDWGRVPWSPSYFGVDRAELAPYAGATVLLWDRPTGYLVPYFPESARFLRIRGKVSGYDVPRDDHNWELTEDNLMWTRITEGIREAQPGRLFLLEAPFTRVVPRAVEARAAQAAMLDRLGLELDEPSCRSLRAYDGAVSGVPHHLRPSRICALRKGPR